MGEILSPYKYVKVWLAVRLLKIDMYLLYGSPQYKIFIDMCVEMMLKYSLNVWT